MLRSIISHFAAGLFVLGVGFASVAKAVTIYATSYEGQAIYKCDTVTNTNTLVYSTTSVGNPDSLLEPASLASLAVGAALLLRRRNRI